jgi:hypothetical protein
MRLRDRVDRLEQLLDRPQHGDGGGGPTKIRVRGGLDTVEPLLATIDGMVIESVPGETVEEFERRAMRIGIETGADYVILGGLPT